MMKPYSSDTKIFSLPDESPEKNAWHTAFFIENHMDYYAYPDHVGDPSQVAFMVYTEKKERYYPCSDKMFSAIMNKNQSAFILEKYNQVLQGIMRLLADQIEDQQERGYLESLITIKFKHETRDEIMVPSRLEKRLMQIFLNRTMINDPYIEEKTKRNCRASEALNSQEFYSAIDHLDKSNFSKFPTTLTEIKKLVEHLEIARLITLSVESSLWESSKAHKCKKDNYIKFFNRPIIGNGVKPLLCFLGIIDKDVCLITGKNKKILWLVDEAGQVVVDIVIIKYLAKLGHKIIISFKEGPLFTKVSFYDTQEDETLKKELEGVFLIKDKDLSKNRLVEILRSDNNIMALPDGTRENVNLLLASTTFARVFKEVDVIISRGHDQKRRFFDTHFQFTQDIFNISEDEHKSDNGIKPVVISYKPKHSSVIKFSHKDLENKARKIIKQMKNSKKDDMTVVFYSGIIGSIPGKIEMAKKIMSIFIKFLKKQFAMTFIVNPSNYYELGMDADDLMYMWEIVQRSGLIDIWRFQTYDDIAKAFGLMNKKVPPEWVGKDATFSTGCTKEMKIAVDVQRSHPEMQIMGPSQEKFMRREEYGVGKMYDQKLVL